MKTWIRIFSLLIIVRIALNSKVCILKLANNLLWNGKLKRMSNAKQQLKPRYKYNVNVKMYTVQSKAVYVWSIYLNAINSHQAIRFLINVHAF